jgi:hypothetical protein
VRRFIFREAPDPYSEGRRFDEPDVGDLSDDDIAQLSRVTPAAVISSTRWFRVVGSLLAFLLIAKWDPEKRVYFRPNGRRISPRDLRGMVDQVIDATRSRIAALTNRFVAGEINLFEWRYQMIQEVKHLNISMGRLAYGGRIPDAELANLAARIRAQLNWLQRFSLKLASGQVQRDGRIVGRAQMYGSAGRATYEATVREREASAGMVRERRVLGASEHCPDCEDAADLDWQPIGTLPDIGESQCMMNCQCSFEFEAGGEGERR